MDSPKKGCTFANVIKKEKKMSRKNSNIRVVSFPIEQYDRSYLDTLTDKELSEAACAEGESDILTLSEFQESLNNDTIDTENKWWYFLTD